MEQRAAIVTGGSGGIGLAVARMLGQEGYALTLTARRAYKLQAAAGELATAGIVVQQVPGDAREEEVVEQVVAAHRDRYGRLDVLVNNAGVGFGSPVQSIETRQLDMQLGINLRSTILFCRACIEMLKAAAAEHHNALVVNTASITGKAGQPWLSVYSATKHGIVGFTEAMNHELAGEGVKSCALCPAFVDTAMTDFVKTSVPAESMITPEDIAEAVRMLLRMSPACLVPEIIFRRPGDAM